MPAIRIPTSEPLLGQRPARHASGCGRSWRSRRSSWSSPRWRWARWVGSTGRTSSASTPRRGALPCSRACPSRSTGATGCTASSRGARSWPRRSRAASASACSTTSCARRAMPSTSCDSSRRPSPVLARLATARNRELVNLSFSRSSPWPASRRCSWRARGEVSSTSLVYAGLFLALFLVAHIALRMRLPQADPYLLPLVGILASVGLCEIYRIGPRSRATRPCGSRSASRCSSPCWCCCPTSACSSATAICAARSRSRCSRSRSCRPTRPAP